jgi:hypothetical protein
MLILLLNLKVTNFLQLFIKFNQVIYDFHHFIGIIDFKFNFLIILIIVHIC